MREYIIGLALLCFLPNLSRLASDSLLRHLEELVYAPLFDFRLRPRYEGKIGGTSRQAAVRCGGQIRSASLLGVVDYQRKPGPTRPARSKGLGVSGGPGSGRVRGAVRGPCSVFRGRKSVKQRFVSNLPLREIDRQIQRLSFFVHVLPSFLMILGFSPVAR